MRSFARFLLILFAVLPNRASAGTSPPNSSIAFSRDGKCVLVMLSPDRNYDLSPAAQWPDGRMVQLHDTFEKSGVYDAVTLQPIWQVNWFSLQCDLQWSDDFRYVIRRNIKGFDAYWAIAFYDRGKVLRRYTCSQLLGFFGWRSCLPFETWDWHTRWYENFCLDVTHHYLELSTARRRLQIADSHVDLGIQDFYSLDISTGSIVARRTTGVWLMIKYALVAATTLLALSLSARLLWRKLKRRSVGRGFEVSNPAAE